MNYLEVLQLAAPETALAITVLMVLAVDLIALRGESVARRFRGRGDGCPSWAACWRRFSRSAHHGSADPLHGLLVVDPQTNFLKVVLLVLAIFTVMISASGTFTEHVGEYLCAGSAGHDRPDVPRQRRGPADDFHLAGTGQPVALHPDGVQQAQCPVQRGGVEIFPVRRHVRGVSAVRLQPALRAFRLDEFAGNRRRRWQGKGLDPLLLVAIVTTVIGFGFKVAAVPFHLWAPDAYEGAPTPSAAFIASGSKVASFYILAKILALGFAGAEGSAAWHGYVSGWTPVIAIVAALSMVLGNLTAIVQIERQTPAGLLGHRPCGLHAARRAGQHAVQPERAAVLCHHLRADGARRIWRGDGGGSGHGRRRAGQFRRAQPARAGIVVVPAGVPAFAGRHSAAGGFHRKIFPVQRGGGRGRRSSWPALAGDPGHR